MEWATRDRYVSNRCENIGIALSTGTFTLQAANGAALSATNPAYVTFRSKTAGNLVRIKVIANQTFIDDSGSSTIIGNLFGFAAGDAPTTTDVPFFIYAVLNDAEDAVSFMISRTSGQLVSPVAGDIGKTGSAIADNGWSFFALSNPTVTDYDSNPCVIIGSFRMRLTTAGGDWTVQTFSSTDGIGSFQESILFTWPVAVMGAATNSFFLPNGGTSPAWSTASRYEYLYRVTVDGVVWANLAFDGDPSTDGVGAVQCRLNFPFRWGGTKNTCAGTGRFGTTANDNILQLITPPNQDYCEPQFVSSALDGALLNVSWQAATFQFAEITFSYPMKKS